VGVSGGEAGGGGLRLQSQQQSKTVKVEVGVGVGDKAVSRLLMAAPGTSSKPAIAASICASLSGTGSAANAKPARNSGMAKQARRCLMVFSRSFSLSMIERKF